MLNNLFVALHVFDEHCVVLYRLQSGRSVKSDAVLMLFIGSPV